MEEGRWCSLSEMSEYLGVSRFTIMNWIEKKKMPACKVGRLWKFKKAEVDEWVKSGYAGSAETESPFDEET